MNTGAVEDYYHMTTMNENTSQMKKKSLNPRAPFSIPTFNATFLIAFPTVRNREKWNLSLIYLEYANPSNNTLLTLTLVCTWYVGSTPQGQTMIQGSYAM